MILKTARFISATLLLVWLGAVITMTFYVAPILFLGGSEAVPDSTVAADIIAPMLHSMEMTGWIVLPIVIVLHGVMWAAIRPRQTRALLFSSQMLALAWVGGLYSGFPLAGTLHSIRQELKQEYGGYHLAPEDHPERARFSKLHGISMIIVLVNLGLGLGSFFCVTQLIGQGSNAPISRGEQDGITH